MPNTNKPSEEMSRTLIRVDFYDPTSDFILVIVSGFSPIIKHRVELKDIPPEIKEKLGNEIRFYATANVGANSVTFFKIGEWEIE